MKALIASLAGLALLAGASAARAQCVIEPGVYSGVANQISQVTKPGVVQATWRFTTAVELTATCEGKATVKFTNTSIQLQVSAILPPPVTGTCKLSIADGTADAVIEAGAGNLPRIKFPMAQKVTFHDCEGLALIWYDFLAYAAMYGPGAAPTSYDFQATEREAPAPVYRGNKPFVVHPSLSGLETRLKDWGGTWTIEYLWVLMRGAAGEGPPPSTDEAKTPVLGQIQGRFERIFLAGIGPIPNVYTVPINWGGEPPGTVTFQLDGVAIPSVLTPAGASANVQIDTLAAGTHTLSVVAVSTKGKQGFSQRPIRIVEMPGWAQEFNIQARTPLQPPFVSYIGQKLLVFSAAQRTVVPEDPVMGGSWGLQQTSVRVLFRVSSAGGIGQDVITPQLTFRIGASNFAPNLTGSSGLRVNLTETALLFVSGTLAFEGSSLTVVRQFKDVFPGFPHRADKAALADSTPIAFTITGSASGIINLGLVDDKLKVSDGEVLLKGVLFASHFSKPANDNLFVTATGEGRVVIRFDPEASVANCVFATGYLGRYEIIESPGLGVPPSVAEVRSQPKNFSGGCN